MAALTPAAAEADAPRTRPARAVELAGSYREFRGGLLGFLQAATGNPAVAEDLLHEVFIKALAALDRGVTPASMPAWLHRIARNTVIDHYRTRRPTETLPDELLVSDGPYRLPPEQTLALCLKPFINELPAIYRDAMLATAIEGRSLVDVSRELELSVSAVKSRVSRGRRMLRKKVLECCHVEVSRCGEVLDYSKRKP